MEHTEIVDSIRNVTIDVTIDQRGLVRRYDLDYWGTIFGDPVHVTRTVQYRAVGTTTIQQPSWYDRAVANASRNQTGSD